MFGERVILTEGAIVERIKRQYDVEVDEYIATASLIYDEVGRGALEGIYKQYIDIAVEKDLPIMIMTSTRRADKERIKQSQYREKDVIGDNVNFLKHMRADYPTYRDKIYIGGILGCKGDA
ncbi:MAG: homocysteine S-methyltransferase family protein, partial [Cellulosilyticaceae bacterium]